MDLDGHRWCCYGTLDVRTAATSVVALAPARIRDQYHVDGAICVVQCFPGMAHQICSAKIRGAEVVQGKPSVLLGFDLGTLYCRWNLVDHRLLYRNDGQ